jgi:hypothetical protein
MLLILPKNGFAAGCLPPIPPVPSAICNGTNWLINDSITTSGLQANSQTPIIVLGNLTLAPNCHITVDSSENAAPIIVQNTAQISENCEIVINVDQAPSGAIPILQASDRKSSFDSVSFETPSGPKCARQTSSENTLLAVVDSCGSNSAGKIAGIVTGSVIGAALLAGVILYVSKKVHMRCTNVFFQSKEEGSLIR